MKDYSTDSRTFSEAVKITETTDLAHADNVNYAPKQIFENTLVNRDKIKDSQVTITYDEDSKSLTFKVGEDS